MCGVIGLVYEQQRPDLGRVAAELLKTLEYRGYDSTGAALQGAGDEVVLRKGVGAPSVMVHKLGIVDLAGQILCGQVRWATFGAVTEANSQPHAVCCHAGIYGAHNGNVTNCDQLKLWLAGEGHRVLSDNDGEMVVHTVEHGFARALAEGGGDPRDPAVRRAAMRRAFVAAAPRLEGSYAAVIVDPVSRCLWAVKQGSSLYFGAGAGEVGGRFAIASSDLTSVLKLTRVVVPLREGELVEFDAGGWQLYSVRDGEALERPAVRSRLRVKDTALQPPFATFMEQEIAAQEETCRAVVTMLGGGAAITAPLRAALDAHPAGDVRRIATGLDALRDEVDDARLRAGFHALADSPELRGLLSRAPRPRVDVDVAAAGGRASELLVSAEAGFLADLLPMARHDDDALAVRLLDALLEREELHEIDAAVERFLDLATSAIDRGGRIFVVCCGSSYNAARAAALFFNEVARTDLVPLLPGEFRERVGRSLRDGDVLVAVSQSGETKDLIDVLNDTIASGRAVRRVALVNNVNSTLAEEKSELVIPLRCGPEVAVPATKSFMNQMVTFYGLALRLGERRLAALPADAPERAAWAAELRSRRARLPELPALLRAAAEAAEPALEEAAQLLYLRSSIHLLATRLTGLAREGALKIREVVLNHAEGFEGSEFKHGPNTILGWNTIFGPEEAETLLRRAAEQPDRATLWRELTVDYPLIYLTGPDERDVNLTVSQINTHKIRGACTVVIAEEHPALRAAAAKAPVDNPRYRWVVVPLPRTGDTLMTCFSATVALQRLALKMSVRKLEYLDRLGVKEHGVHPDVPKNVSKSITVD